ncbi:MAG: cytidylate kinase family protein [Candidatus Woesearchaeota archaeon]|jgi:cytidylate kinase
MSLKITISGEAGAGKSTVADILAKKLKINRHSTGDYMRTMAAARGVTIIELNKISETDASIDKELDDWQKKMEKSKESFVIDSRLGFHFIPSSLKIFLCADESVRAQRIFESKRLVESNTTLKKTLTDMKKRKQLEKKRYIHKYGVDYFDLVNYDIIIDSTILAPQEIAEKIIQFLKINRNI